MDDLLKQLADVTPKEAAKLQKELQTQVKLVPLKKKPLLIAGADVSTERYATKGYAGLVTLSYPELKEVDESIVKDKIPFPYIPGLLSFREVPMLVKAWGRLTTKPDVILVDGVGIAHPRRMGIATHLGMVLNIPTIGCAKSVLTGTYEEPPEEPGSVSFLYDTALQSEIIGAAVRTKRGVKPVFVSAGYLITLEEALEIVQHCVRKHRLPEPTRLAHLAVNRMRLHMK